MRRSTFVLIGMSTFGLILATFIVRGTTRLVLGDRTSLLLSLPFATVSILFVLVLLFVASIDLLGIQKMEDDLGAAADEP